jgi:hypothetical protein
MTSERLKEGERLWNGAIVTTSLAKAYNALQDRIESFEGDAPEHLIDGSHNLIASALKGKH